MNILYFLTPKSEVEYIRIESSVRQGLEKMKYHGYAAIPVIDKEGHYEGTVTEGDFLWALYNDNNPDSVLRNHANRKQKSVCRSVC